jgi:hypothetical protein
MKFIQIMEFTGSAEEAINSINNYIAIAGAETTVKRATVCEDKDNPGQLLQIIEFNSYEDAQINNDLEVTKKASEEDTSNFGEVQFKNLNVLRTFDL